MKARSYFATIALQAVIVAGFLEIASFVKVVTAEPKPDPVCQKDLIMSFLSFLPQSKSCPHPSGLPLFACYPEPMHFQPSSSLDGGNV